MVLAIGMNSGSSFDGIDVALIDVDPAPDGAPTRPRLVTDRLPNNVPACSGASGYALMGQLSLPPRLAAEPPSGANGAVSAGPRQA